MDGDSWAKLVPFQLSILKSLYARRINFPFLHAVAYFWDPQKHIFWLNKAELCPLQEEFEALLGRNMDSTYQLAIPNLGVSDPHSIQYQMARIFNLPP